MYPDRLVRQIELTNAWRDRALDAEALNLALKEKMLELDVRQQQWRQVRAVVRQWEP